jgi:DNA-directed RNA polymerase specialized sigma subunit
MKKLTERDIYIIKDRATFMRQKDIAKVYNISRSLVSRIVLDKYRAPLQ